MKYVKKLSELPKDAHFAVMIEKQHSIYHEGDERSRTHPGHGYPAYTETINYFEYAFFENQKELEDWIAYNNGTSKYVVLEVTPRTFERKVVINLK